MHADIPLKDSFAPPFDPGQSSSASEHPMRRPALRKQKTMKPQAVDPRQLSLNSLLTLDATPHKPNHCSGPIEFTSSNGVMTDPKNSLIPQAKDSQEFTFDEFLAIEPTSQE